MSLVTGWTSNDCNCAMTWTTLIKVFITCLHCLCAFECDFKSNPSKYTENSVPLQACAGVCGCVSVPHLKVHWFRRPTRVSALTINRLMLMGKQKFTDFMYWDKKGKYILSSYLQVEYNRHYFLQWDFESWYYCCCGIQDVSSMAFLYGYAALID